MLTQVSDFRLLKVQLCLYDLAKTKGLSWVWRLMPVIPALRKLRQEDLDFEAGLGCLVRLCLKTMTTTTSKQISSFRPEMGRWTCLEDSCLSFLIVNVKL